MIRFHSIMRILRTRLGLSQLDLHKMIRHGLIDEPKYAQAYISSVEHDRKRLQRNDLDPLIDALNQGHNRKFLTYKWHESQPSIRVSLNDPKTPNSLRTLVSMYDAGIYPDSEALEKLVRSLGPNTPADIANQICQSQGTASQSP